MGLPEFPSQLPLFGADHLLGRAFADDDPFRLFQQRIYPLLLAARPTLEQMYCRDNGRPACEPVLLLGLTLLQFMHKLPDRGAMEALKYHMGWKLALNQPLEMAAPDASLLCLFRQRLLENEQSGLLFDTILKALIEAGLVSRRGKRRLDSTAVVGLVAVLSEAEKLQQTLRLALEYLQEHLGALPAWCEPLLERYVQSRPEWRMDKEAAERYCRRAGADLLALRSWLYKEHADLREARPLQLLERVYQESFEVQADGTLEPRKKLAPGSLVNPHEPEAVMARKREQKWTGYKVQISESVPEQTSKPGEPTSALITAVHTQKGSEGDIKSMEAIRSAETRVGLETPQQRYVDCAYVSGKQLRQELEAGGELMGPIHNAEHPSEAKGFVIAPDGQHATCPSGHVNESCRSCTKAERDAQYHRLVWKECCEQCPQREGCVGKNGERYVETRADYDLIQQRRVEQKSEAFKVQMHQRNAIEGTGSELVRAHGLRRARYRGLLKVHLGHLLIAAACNVKRWVRRMQYDLGRPVGAVLSAAAEGGVFQQGSEGRCTMAL